MEEVFICKAIRLLSSTSDMPRALVSTRSVPPALKELARAERKGEDCYCVEGVRSLGPDRAALL